MNNIFYIVEDLKFRDGEIVHSPSYIADLIKILIIKYKYNELLLDYLSKQAPTLEEQDIIYNIMIEEKKNLMILKNIHDMYSKLEIVDASNIKFSMPESFIDGIKKSKFAKLESIKDHLKVYFAIKEESQKNLILGIIMDELIHSSKYEFIIDMNLQYQIEGEDYYTRYKETFTLDEVKIIAKKLRIDFNEVSFTLDEFRAGMIVELEHGKINEETNITDDDPILTGKIALAHLNELPDYYTRLKKMEEEAI